MIYFHRKNQCMMQKKKKNERKKHFAGAGNRTRASRSKTECLTHYVTGPVQWNVRFLNIYRKWPISISVSCPCTKSVILLLHIVWGLDFSPIEFSHVAWNSNLKWIWTRGGERSFPFPGKAATGKGFINFRKGSFPGKGTFPEPFPKLMNPFPVAAIPGRGKDLSQ